MNRYLLISLVSAVVGALLALVARDPGAATSAQAQAPLTTPIPRITSRPETDVYLTPEERVNVSVYENVNRSVVNINTKVVSRETIFRFEVPAEGAGSGSVLDTQGHILTNHHVVDGAKEIQVILYDGKSHDAQIVGQDELTDIAVLKIDAPAESLIPVVLGDSTTLKVGQNVYAIGNPFGLERTLTVGIISSLNRTLPTRNHRTISAIIQIDAAINPGNSGGPLLDSRSRLIGMNTAIASSTGQSSGVGFAIPTASIARVVPQLIQRGRVIRPDAGIVRVMQTEQGLLIATMTPNGPAEKAGLRGFRIAKERKTRGPFVYETQSVDRSSADLIVAVDGQKAITAAEFLNLVEAKRPGDEVRITVIREGREVHVPVRLVAGDS